MRKTGYYQKIGDVEHFMPNDLPPTNPPLDLDIETVALYGDTMLAIGQLNEMTKKLPDIRRFIKAYVTKEALLSSSIEGINTTLLDVFTQPLLESKPNKATQLVMNYIQSLYGALQMIKEQNLPIATRVILEAHKLLMQTGEGDKSNPGNYRKQSVKVGNLVPPPALQVPQFMAQLENYINTNNSLPALVKAGLAHIQFETIHPFLDGNGRIGRLLIVLIFIDNGLLIEPILYPSYYFKKHQLEYYQKLDAVRSQGDFEGWIKFYLKIIKDSSIDAYKRATNIETLMHKLHELINNQEKLSNKMRENRISAISVIFNYPVISTNELSSQLNISYNTASQIITDFIELDILQEETQQKRGKLFKFSQYLEILEKKLD